uniref:Uncharacterized protein n=1 Tax=Anguilla anguilla TaxID=7936 RepID=A0A0E9PS47_ANGAN
MSNFLIDAVFSMYLSKNSHSSLCIAFVQCYCRYQSY